MFRTKAKPCEEPTNDWWARANELAREAEVAALGRADTLLEEFKDHNRRDRESFALECRRHGDFLWLAATRGGGSSPAGEEGEAGQPRRDAVSLHIDKAVIRLASGRPADRDGTLLYALLVKTPEGVVRPLYEDSGVRDGEEVQVQPSWPAIGTPVLFTPAASAWFPADHQMQRYGPGNYYALGHQHLDSLRQRLSGHVTTPFPRPAEDDRIQFDLAGRPVTLSVPHPLGLAALAEIHRALESGVGGISKVTALGD